MLFSGEFAPWRFLPKNLAFCVVTGYLLPVRESRKFSALLQPMPLVRRVA
jgi:hypothetical protein